MKRRTLQICLELRYMFIFWNTVDCMLSRTVRVLEKLEHDVENHALAVLEKRYSVEQLSTQMREHGHGTRRSSCYHSKVKQEKTKTRKHSFSWMRASKRQDKEQDSGIESRTDSAVEDTKFSKESKITKFVIQTDKRLSILRRKSIGRH